MPIYIVAYFKYWFLTAYHGGNIITSVSKDYLFEYKFFSFVIDSVCW